MIKYKSNRQLILFFAPSLFGEIRKWMEADAFACFEHVIRERSGMAKKRVVLGQ